jgi:hypothetical protein
MSGPDRAPKTVTAKVEHWYRDKYVPARRAEGRKPSRDADLKAAREEGFNAPRDYMRDLRKRYAPATWTKSGRPKTGDS